MTDRWTCGTSTAISDEPPDCPPGAPLHLVLTFQDCWDGEYLASEDHVSHAAYSEDGACPTTHPVHLPQLTVSVAFPISGGGHDLLELLLGFHPFTKGMIHPLILVEWKEQREMRVNPKRLLGLGDLASPFVEGPQDAIGS